MCRYAVDFFVHGFLFAPAIYETENNLFSLILRLSVLLPGRNVDIKKFFSIVVRFIVIILIRLRHEESRAVARKPRDAAAVLSKVRRQHSLQV